MRSIPFVLEPLVDITGNGPRWQAASAEPWFLLVPEEPLAWRWVCFRWSAGLLDLHLSPSLSLYAWRSSMG